RAAGLQDGLVFQRLAAGDGLAVAVGGVVGRQRLDVVVAFEADDAEVVSRTGAVQDADVGRLVAPDEERLAGTEGVGRLRLRVEQGRVVHRRHGGSSNVLPSSRGVGVGHPVPALRRGQGYGALLPGKIFFWAADAACLHLLSRSVRAAVNRILSSSGE